MKAYCIVLMINAPEHGSNVPLGPWALPKASGTGWVGGQHLKKYRQVDLTCPKTCRNHRLRLQKYFIGHQRGLTKGPLNFNFVEKKSNTCLGSAFGGCRKMIVLFCLYLFGCSSRELLRCTALTWPVTYTGVFMRWALEQLISSSRLLKSLLMAYFGF